MEYNTLLKEYTRYIEKIANSWSNRDSDVSKDLEQEGRLALWSAIKTYNPAKGKEKTYITTMIKMAMRKWLTANLRTIRIPSHVQFGPDREDIELQTTISLDTVINEDGDTISNLVKVDEQDTSMDDHQLRIFEIIARLTKDEQYILFSCSGYLNDGDKKTLEEMGKEFGITKEGMRLRLEKIKNKIKAAI